MKNDGQGQEYGMTRNAKMREDLQKKESRENERGSQLEMIGKSFELIKHLQFQYSFMDSRLGSLFESTHLHSLPQAPDPQNSNLPILAQSLAMVPPQEEPEEPQELLKRASNPQKTRSDGLLINSKSISGEQSNNMASYEIQGGQQKSAKNSQQLIQSEKQISQQVNQPNPDPQIPSLSGQKITEKENQFVHKNQCDKGSSPTKKRKSMKSYCYEDDENSQQIVAFKFPYMNNYLKNHSVQYLRTLELFDQSRDVLKKTANNTFINCDVKYFNWQLFGQQVGKFDVVLIDPPWRIKGAQQNDSQFMFSNCKFSLQYNTMANSQIARIPLHMLTDQGFIFLWILNSQLDASLQIMEGWGYELVEEVIWVKLKDEKINLTHGYYFMHSYQVCLIGYKCKKDKSSQERLKIRKGISWNTIFAEVREKSQKPEDIYAIIDIMFKGGTKIQIFARNHNLRFGIFSVGNQLGQSYDKWLLKLQCDECGNMLPIGKKRYKSKHTPNYDLCPKCILTKQKQQFFQLSNNVNENIKHEYISCNHCGAEPIWGLRFQCITCHDFDICQNCFDKNLKSQTNFHPTEHQFMFLEVPVFGNGFHIHESKCASCYQNPIIGIYFSCSTCRSLNLCQKCYFQRPKASFNNLNRRHKPDHQLEVIFQSQIQQSKRYECFNCKREILEECWMCENCYNFFFCSQCYEKRDEFKSLYANTHKAYHVLNKIF